MSWGEPIAELIFKRLLNNGSAGLISKDSAVLSCGGMYIPHKGNRSCIIHEIINTPGTDEAVRIIASAKPRNILHDVLLKESLN